MVMQEKRKIKYTQRQTNAKWQAAKSERRIFECEGIMSSYVCVCVWVCVKISTKIPQA